jgi:DMSO/TMAO reductase YedYZ heme-binding membrane subunit
MQPDEIKKSFLRRHLKALIIGSAFLLSLAVNYIATWNNSTFLGTIRIVQYDGFIAIAYLFLSMFAGPFYRVFPNAPLKQIYRESLSGLGISTFYFALLHSWIGFFSLMAGFTGLKFLSTSYLLSTILGTIALFILTILAGTSFDIMRKKLGPWWKFLHRFVYTAAVLTVIHILIIGSDFLRFTSVPATLSFIAFLILLILHALTTQRLLLTKYPKTPKWYFSVGILLVIALFLFSLYKLHTYVAGVHLH